MGQPVAVLDTARFTGQQLPGTGWIAGLGSPGTEISVIDEDGVKLPEGTLGEIVVSSPSVAMGYRRRRIGPGHFYPVRRYWRAAHR